MATKKKRKTKKRVGPRKANGQFKKKAGTKKRRTRKAKK